MLFIFFGGAAVVIAIDLITKAVFFEGSTHTLISGFLSIVPRGELNTGAAFSLFDGGGIWLIIITSIVICFGVFLFFRFRNKSLLFNIACALIFGGALGNLYDRIFLGGVRDFISFDFIDFPIFNFADCCLNVGMVLLAVWLLFFYKVNKGAKNGTD